MAFNIIGEFILKGTDKAVQQFNSVSKSTKTLNAELKYNRDAVGTKSRSKSFKGSDRWI